MRVRFRLHPWFLALLFAISIFIFNEFLVYYLTILFGCQWPKLSNSTLPSSHVFVVADVHLLGIYRGHWFDKLRREWQMYRSFQTALYLLNPDAVFFLGDQFDEGLWGPEAVFDGYASRFEEIMFVPSGVQRFVLVGNHDVGFHYEIAPARLNRFSKRYNPDLISHASVGRNHFVMINSMAMERDGCGLCQEAEMQLQRLQQWLDCAKKRTVNCSHPFKIPYSQPILMQHFPLFRADDQLCGDEADTAPEPLKSQKFRERWECLSMEATKHVLKALNPRAAFDGHTHFGCRTWWPDPYGFWEWTAPSFSWRNTAQPGLLLLTISEVELMVNKCLLPNEKTVICLYIVFAFLIFACLLYPMFRFLKARKRKQYPTYEFFISKSD